MGSNDRFYQLEFVNRPVLNGDVGSLLKIEGLVVGGADAQGVLLLPGSGWRPNRLIYSLSAAEWSDWLQRSDNPEILVQEQNLRKIFHRKVRYEISGAIQQKVWVADGLKCVYCRRPMGEVQLTVDHFLPLELGGVNDASNYLAACRKCNKDKGSRDPKEFCQARGLKYETLQAYLQSRPAIR